jgi:hypothetical protein
LPPSKNGADALIATGDEQRAVVPAGGLVVVYGDAGAGRPNPGGRLRVLVEPWAAVTLRNEGHRASSPACATSSGST